jgi:signal transduction histidine kinase
MNENLPTRAGRVLVLNVNDHEGVRYMISRILDRAGFAVEEASNGIDALAKVDALAPRLVVLDIKLPDISGLEICRQIKSNPRLQWIKVLHTSAIFVAPEAKVQSLNSGADGYLSYPFEQEELIATARSLLRLLEAEQRLRDTAAELQAANQRTHEFLAMLAHELRNPLSAITTCLPVLDRHDSHDELESSARRVMKRQTKHLRRLVDDLLDAARVTQGKIEPKWETVELVSLLSRVTETVRRMLTNERDQELHLHVPSHPVFTRGDSLRLEQVLSNLLDNASKYTDSGGRIDVELSVTRDEPGQVRVVVRDTGVGIPTDALNTVFDLFSQANVPLARSRGGLGIGLTLVKTLIDLHGGTVQARSAGVGQGCEIEVRLPMATTRLEHAHAPDSAAVQGSPRRRVLVVEDNPDARQMLRCLLEMWGHDVAEAADGGAGIEAIATYRPDVALVDIGLPVKDGYELARQVRSHGKRSDLLLVALTGYGAAEQRERALDAGFDLHLVKPVEPEDLASIIAGAAAG